MRLIGVLALGLVLAGCNTTGRVKAVQSDVDAYIACGYQALQRLLPSKETPKDLAIAAKAICFNERARAVTTMLRHEYYAAQRVYQLDEYFFETMVATIVQERS